MKQIVVYGGTFDPPTLAHESIIGACLERQDFDEVWLMPSGIREDKPDMLSNEQRLGMLALIKERLFHGTDRLKISYFELDLPQPTETYETVQALKRSHPQCRFWFVFGADSYHDMPQWRGGSELQQTLGMLLVERQGFTLPSENKNVRHLNVPGVAELGLSSTIARENIRTGLPILGIVSPAIAERISTQNLYSQGTINW